MVTPEVLARIATIGPYFAVGTGPRPDGFRPLTELYEDGAALDACVGAVADRLGTDRPRVAASTLHLGTASRLWSLALACAAYTGRVPDLNPGRLWWRLPASGPLDLWLTAPSTLDEEDPRTALHRTVVVDNLAPWADAVRRTSGVSPHTLRGNAASALIGAHRVLLTRAPHTPLPVVPLVRALLDHPPLAGAGTYAAPPARPLTFRRRSCCLYYRVPGAGTCGDCVLTNHREKTA
ncbi:FhuF 2Fe-2S C-terminal domain-containing protein [Streptomyces sp. DI166]|uniref:(2Fe-2S)-binding protein n=1 Tax=Streptomyces sp. DI166 TaxID=1839783 RepID=UPI0007F37995|nr:(2Fe-2S)-binding protein [Streptomyces sp. DI166]SBT89963.1 FhuF 2Fe-2S C-terminal domain-containing protein [Streptomyces sp. DI166]